MVSVPHCPTAIPSAKYGYNFPICCLFLGAEGLRPCVMGLLEPPVVMGVPVMGEEWVLRWI